MIFSAFRIRFVLALPLVGCAFAWLCVAGSSEGHCWISWKKVYVSDFIAKYLGEERDPADFRRRVAALHDESHDFWGIHYSVEYTGASAPPPFSSLTLSRSISVHYAVMTVLSGLPLATYLVLERKRHTAARRKKRGLCGSCGYDVRAHDAGQKCPECGTVISNSTRSLSR